MLTKPEVNFLIVITTLAGFYLVSAPRPWRILLLFNALFGTLLVASGTGTLNQYIERQFRFTHAPYVETTFACRANCTRPRSVVRPWCFPSQVDCGWRFS